MWDRFAWSVAIRQLRYGIAQTALTVGVVSISVILIIFVGSLITGLQRQLIDIVTGALPNIVIRQPERVPIAIWEVPGQEDEELYIGTRQQLEQRQAKIEDWQIWLTRLQRFDPQIIAVSPIADGGAVLARGATQRGIVLTGVIPERYNPVVNIEEELVEGRFIGLKPGEIALGQTLAEDLDIELDDKVRISIADGVPSTFTVSGIYDTGYPEIDSLIVYTTLGDAQSLLGLGNAVTSIGLRLRSVFEADEIARRLRLQVPYEVESWMEENQQLLTALRSQTQTISLILTFIIIASGFGIASILITSVASKIREIGILRAIGATRRQIIGLFTLQSVLMAAIGGLVGIGAGVGLSIAAYRYRVAVVAGGREEEVFPILLTPQLILGAFAVAVIVGLLASFYPAWRASRVNPIEVIRGA